jgi:hypothetical protein
MQRVTQLMLRHTVAVINIQKQLFNTRAALATNYASAWNAIVGTDNNLEHRNKYFLVES